MNENAKIKAAGVIVGRDEISNKPFEVVLYSNDADPKTVEKKVNSDEIVEAIKKALINNGYDVIVKEKVTTEEEWKTDRALYIMEAKELAETIEIEQLEARAEAEIARNKEIERVEKTKAIEEKSGTKRLKAWGAVAVAIVIAAGGYSLGKQSNNNANAPKLGTPAITTPVGPIDAKIAAMKEQFAKDELNYDITDPAEAERRLNILIGYSEKMQKNELTRSEIADLFLLSNGIKPIGDVNVGELVTKAAVAFAYDPAFDWEEIPGQEVIANKRDSEYLGMFLDVINDWKAAAEGNDNEKTAEIGKRLLEMSIRSFQFNESLNTDNPSIGAVKLQNIGYSNQALLMCYVASTISYPRLNVNDIIKPVTIDGDKMTVMHLMKALAGPNVIPAGEDGRTDKGGEEGLVNSILMTLINDLNQGNFAECPQDLKAKIEGLTKGQVKVLK